jgi:FtsP/CotA-like multicopper oxidase with cupredoxin domain
MRVGGKPTAGVIKDIAMLGGFQEVEFDFVADNPGLTLFHCHQQLHMDFGFMFLFNYALDCAILTVLPWHRADVCF